jgi:prolyl-tRNA synthetase
MKRSQLLGRTLRESPHVSDPWTELAIRAAIVRIVDDQVISLPLGERVITRLMDTLRSVHPTAQEVGLHHGLLEDGWLQLLQDEIQSYRQLPVTLLSQRTVKSLEPAQGLARPPWRRALQWFRMSTTGEDLRKYHDQWVQNVEISWSEIGIAPRWLEWRSGEHGWAYLHEKGPDEMFSCTACEYLASVKVAKFRRQSDLDDNLEEMKVVATPGADTIRALAEMLSVPESKTLKAVFLTGDDEQLVLVVVRGDLDVSLAKISDATGIRSLRPANEEVIRSSGAEPGYASPIGLDVRESLEEGGILVVADLSIEQGMNFIAGANKPGLHMKGVNFPRDFMVTIVTDIAQAKEGDGCPECDASLTAARGMYLGGWRWLMPSILYSSEDGHDTYAQVGLGTLFMEPILAALLAEHRDDQGMIWPARIAPFEVYLVDLKCPKEAKQVVEALEAIGLSVLHDDRKASPGVKFTDADLIGLPLRLTVSRRSLEQGGVEFVVRGKDIRQILPLESIGESILTVFNTIM